MSDQERKSGGSSSRSHGIDAMRDTERHRHSSSRKSSDRERAHRGSSRRLHDDHRESRGSNSKTREASSESRRKRSKWDDENSGKSRDEYSSRDDRRDDRRKPGRSSDAKGRALSRSPSSRRQPDFEQDRATERQRYLDAIPPAQSAQDVDAALPDEDAPNFQSSGLLAAESNQKNGVALKYHEPPEARKPKRPWRMYAYKDAKEQEMLVLGAQSAYLLGRDRTVVDIPLDHPSCSKQHAVLQFRQTIETNEFGDQKKRIRPFVIDLESANGCEVNEKEIPPSRYYEIKNGDTLHFGASTREYVMIDEGAV